MSSQLESFSLPPAVRRVAVAFRIAGEISLWSQGILGLIATVALLFAILGSRLNTTNASNPGTNFGIFCAFGGILMLYVGAYWAFYHYIRLSKRLRSPDPRQRPKPKDATQSLRVGLIINLVGMLLTLIGGQAIIGSLFAKSLSQPQGGAIFAERTGQFVQPLDIFTVQINMNVILAHFIAIVASLWLIRTMSRQ